MLANAAEQGATKRAIEPEVNEVIPENSELQEDTFAMTSRKEIENSLRNTEFLTHDHPLFFHGRAYNGPTVAPKQTWSSELKPRDDHDAPAWLTASEYCDLPNVLHSKVAQMAQLITISKRTIIYSGAGISLSAGIGQAARGAAKGGGKSTDASPTYTHYALGALAKEGLLHGWVQQNHDGLPQKGGFPQEYINEIHGSWYDPSNPVVKYSGSLKGELFPWMEEEAGTADLVIVLGTSLGGLNADQVAITPAKRSKKGHALGSIMINLQQTEQDGKMSLRIFEKSDKVLKMLLQALGIKNIPMKPAVFCSNSKVIVPYDRDGNRSETAKMWLDLTDGAKVKLTSGHNVQGAQQPQYMHIGAAAPYKYNGIMRKNGPGHGVVKCRNDAEVSYELEIEGVRMKLGQWWIEAAKRGGPKSLPIINQNPVDA